MSSIDSGEKRPCSPSQLIASNPACAASSTNCREGKVKPKTFAFSPALFFFTAIKKNQIAVAHLTRYWSKLTLWISFLFPVVEWEEEIDETGSYIFCPNHVSTLDIPLLLAVLPKG